MNPFVGMIAMFAFSRIPNGWALCDGQLLSIAEYETLYVLIGTTYGGNGQTTFGLPDLRGKLPIHQGQGLGFTNRPIGSQGGAENVTLTIAQLPPHNHIITAFSDEGNVNAPAGAYPANTGALDNEYKSAAGPINVQMNAGAVTSIGGSQSFSILQPTLTLNFCISLFGIFPTQS
jgi:microcystin-dependent protein